DPDDGDAKLVANLAQHVGRLFHLGFIEAAQTLICEQQLRSGGERLRKLQLLQASSSQPVDQGGAVRRQADHGERVFSGVLGLSARPSFCWLERFRPEWAVRVKKTRQSIRLEPRF